MIEVSPEAGVEPMGLDLTVANGEEMRFASAFLQQSLHRCHKPLLLFSVKWLHGATGSPITAFTAGMWSVSNGSVLLSN
jgi:hypothetical protein